jgi:hypothetical protein
VEQIREIAGRQRQFGSPSEQRKRPTNDGPWNRCGQQFRTTRGSEPEAVGRATDIGDEAAVATALERLDAEAAGQAQHVSVLRIDQGGALVDGGAAG